MPGSTCVGCGTPIPPSRGNRARKWCTDSCRKRTLYARQCVDCGATCNTDGRVTSPSVRCIVCAGLANDRTDARVKKAIEMVRLRVEENMTNVAIAEALATPVNTVTTELHRMRCLGFNVPASPYGGAAKRTGTGSVLDAGGEKLGRALASRGITP